MKKNAWAALVAVTLSLAPGAVLAWSAAVSATVTRFDGAARTIVGMTASRTVEKLQILPGTVYRGVDCPDLIVSTTCRNIANRWNLALVSGQSSAYFEGLLGEMACQSCGAEYVRGDARDQAGAYGLVSVRPAP